MRPPFEALVREYYQPLYRFALSLSGQPADACDLTQQTFALWAERGHQLRAASKAKGWLFTTLYREFLKSKRQTARHPHVELSQAEPELPSISAASIEALEATEVLAALQSLEPIFREPLSLFYLGNQSYKEIAAVLSLPTGTVMSRLARGKQRLRLALARRETLQTPEAIPFSLEADHE